MYAVTLGYQHNTIGKVETKNAPDVNITGLERRLVFICFVPVCRCDQRRKTEIQIRAWVHDEAVFLNPQHVGRASKRIAAVMACYYNSVGFAGI